MPHYKVGKGENYRAYIMDTLRLMWDAEVVMFTLTDIASWAGLPNTTVLREVLDGLVLSGWLSVEAKELRAGRSARTYVLRSAVWLLPPQE